MTDATTPRGAPAPTGLDSKSNLAFETKVKRSALALRFEKLWPRLWLVAAVVLGFLAVSLAGVWPMLGPALHKLLLTLFFAAFIAAIVHAATVKPAPREAALRRLEKVSGLPHRPASSYEDQLSGGTDNPATRALWAAHKQRLTRLIARLRVGRPEPRTDRHDPFAVRAVALLGVLALTGLVGDSALDRIKSAFRINAGVSAADVRLDAWLTPPPYTAKPPIMLADGANSAAVSAESKDKVNEIPERSLLVARATGPLAKQLELIVEPDGGKPERFAAPPAQAAGDPIEVRRELRQTGTLRVISSGSELGSWKVSVIPDNPPVISLTKPPESSPRGSMKLNYKVEDDYGVASAQARIEKRKEFAPDPAKAWARTELKGPRLPLERPPQLSLRLPRSGAKAAEAQTYLELGSHPWAGMPVRLTLEAKDVAGQVGRSAPVDLVLPGRLFQKPLARAVVEQRRKLIDDSRNRPNVIKALAAITLSPEGFIDSTHVYLGLRDAYHRLQRDKTRAGLKSVEQQLWHVALRIEDGDLSDAERALREAQDKLAKALENGASDQEIQQLMQDLKQALNNYMEQLSKEAQNNQQMQNGQNKDQQMLSQSDLDRMMKNIENLAKNGAREQAQQMLSEMRDILERLQAGRMNEQQQQQSRQMMQKMDELGNIVGNQQKLMDDTFGEQKKQGQKPQRGDRNKGQQQGQKGQGQQGQQGKGVKGQQQGQKGQGQQGQQGQQGDGNDGPGQQGLGERQKALREKLDQLQREMGELGMGSEQLGKAEESMGNAEQALENGDMEGATMEQGQALEQMRQGAKQMAQEMMKNMPQRYGQNGDAPRDPLGRPQKSEGPDLGQSVKVPDEIDMQRAREILEELRRRSGEATRPAMELDYLERLLKRF